MKAVIYKSTGSWYQAKTTDGKFLQARVKGIFKIEGLTSTNPIAVGDEVELEQEDESGGIATIHFIYDRRNYIARSSPHNRMQHHIIASNLDQTALFATLRDPKTSQGFLDRFLVSAEAYHVPALVIFNKADLYKKKELEKYERLQEVYTQNGYRVLLLSIAEKKGVDELAALLHDKTTLLSGHSGVGKSTFLNYLFPDLNIKTQEVSGWSGKGLHTTTFAEMFDLPMGGTIIDTPGIREFGLTGIEKNELAHYFPEMRRVMQYCQFNNCLHINEPDCAVKDAVAEGSIDTERYVSYLNIMETINEANY